MKPPPFEYYRPQSVAEVLELLARFGDDAKLLAGGQSLIPTMNFRLARPEVLLDLNRIGELAYIREANGSLRIGAMTRQRQAERSDPVARRAPLLAETLPYVAHPQIRNRGTIGGSIAHADPAAELPAVMLALEARFRLRGPEGERSVPVEDFFTGLFGTVLQPEELLTEVEIPAPAPRSGFGFAEISRRHGDYALAGVAAALALDEAGRCESARIALLSVGHAPVLALAAAGELQGTEPTEEAIRAAADAAAHRDIDPPSDIHASAAYRRRLVEVLVRRVLPRAVERATENDGLPS